MGRLRRGLVRAPELDGVAPERGVLDDDEAIAGDPAARQRFGEGGGARRLAGPDRDRPARSPARDRVASELIDGRERCARDRSVPIEAHAPAEHLVAGPERPPAAVGTAVAVVDPVDRLALLWALVFRV